ncbi:GntR family transcriptional regulator [Castellaniella sp. GW247-6E4]|uniref:GntR family transcriptional regulator n=1 Tax=Castellaniella sp. GW247-6E4 TaxID=3140380 RepID=UPI0033146633
MRPAPGKDSVHGKASRKLDAETVYHRIQNGILERRLLPGAKLAEERLVEATGVSRMKIREVLARLAHEQVVTLIPNRGAYVAQPTMQEAREMFETRRLIEPPLIAKLCRQARPADIAALRVHLDQELSARQCDDLRGVIRLSGEFHVRLVDMVATGIQARVVRELTSLTCLIITLYDKPDAPACRQSEHVALVDMIEAREAERASNLMLEHLNHIEQGLDLDGHLAGTPDLKNIFLP